MPTNEISFTQLADVPVWFHNRDEPNEGDEVIRREEQTYYCTNKLRQRLDDCLGELFEIWPLGAPRAILSFGTIGDGGGAHGLGNAFDLSGFELHDGTLIRVFDYHDWRLLLDGVNAQLFLYFPQVLNHFYPDHRDHFHVDFNWEPQDHFRRGSQAQTYFVQALLRNAFEQDIGRSGRYRDGIDGDYGNKTRSALDRVFRELDLSGTGGLGNAGVWRDFIRHGRNASFEDHQRPLDGAGRAGTVTLARSRSFDVLTQKVYNRGRPPESFLNELIDWALEADDEVFTRNESYDIYSRVVGELGPWQDARHRRAAMCEVLRILGGFESSWDWTEGRDRSANNTEHDEIEGGLFQCSANSIYFFKDDPYLETIYTKLGVSRPGRTRSERFLEVMKSDHPFALEYCARLLRHTINHHGPIKHYRGRRYQGRFHDGIGNHIKRAAVDELLMFL